MYRIPVQMHLPIHASIAHLYLELRALLERDEGIVGADAHEDPSLDRFGVCLRRNGGKTAVKTNDSPDIRSRSRKFQTHGPAKAETNRSYASGVNLRTRLQRK